MRAAAAERRRLAGEDRRQAAEDQAREQRAEQEWLKAFFEHAGMDAELWPAFMHMVRTTSGKAVECGVQSPAHGNGLLLYSRPRKDSAFQRARPILALADREGGPEPAEGRRLEPGHQALRLRARRPPDRDADNERGPRSDVPGWPLPRWRCPRGVTLAADGRPGRGRGRMCWPAAAVGDVAEPLRRSRGRPGHGPGSVES